ncbi:WD40/YVTN/BNR-like repeat-containing protein [Actinomadura fibrosa]|uniref:WD40/YVTN/BNR-like repeat-containing protein n=1 Tax=Actinomadura fibrosa TaxID=111802 RepID=A0ABW2XR90_9ACTN|nr:hypothetical protein [Actinomadura fibrosa]
MMRRLIPLAAALLGLSACGTVQAADESRVQTGGAAPIDAALVTSGFGWVLTSDRLLLTTDGGARFSEARPPVPVTDARAAHFTDAMNGYVAASDGDGITTARTADGGRTWTTATLRDPSAPAEYGRLRTAFRDAAHGAVLAQTSATAMSSAATLFTTDDGGATWSARRAPVSGEVALEPSGRIWVAGGVAGDRLSFTTDQGRHWTDAKTQLNGSIDTKAIAPPVDGVLPVTVVDGSDRTQVALLTSTDQGRSWRESRDRIDVHGRTGPGVRIPVAPSTGGLLVVDTAGSHAYRVPSREPASDVRPTGLPEGADAVTFAPGGRTGWTLATYGRCTKGKTGCTLYHPLLTTTDGGATWRQLRMWQQRLN